MISPWSVIFSFTTQPLPEIVPELLSPANGATGVSLTPAFSWSPIAGTTGYRFILADNPSLAMPLVDTHVVSTGYVMNNELEPGKTYFWAAKAVAPVESEWSTIADFTVTLPPKEPAPPVVVQEMPPPVISIPSPPSTEIVVMQPRQPEQVIPTYIWAIIIIGAILIIVVVIMIFRTRSPF